MTGASHRRRNVLICLCLAVTIVAVYWPVSHFEFINYDDNGYVTENLPVRDGLTLRGLVWAFTTNHMGNWHPLTWLSLMLDCQLFGLKAGPHHLVNVLFHIVNTLLLFSVLNRMTRAPWRSGSVAALFALHPLHVESVAWVAERKDVLSAFFWMLTMWAYVQYVETLNAPKSAVARPSQAVKAKAERSPVRRSLGEGGTPHAFYSLALLFFTLGLMAKPMLVTLPFVLLLLDYWPLGRTRCTKSVIVEKTEAPLSHLLKEKLPFLALAVISCGVTFWAQRAAGAVAPLERLPIGERVANAVVSYARYLSAAFWPSGLAVFYPHRKWPWEVVVGAGVVLVGVSGWVIWRGRREPHFVTGWLWYLGTLVPVIGLVQVGVQSMADRYTYLPLIGVFMMAAWCIPNAAVGQQVGRMIVAGAAALVLIVCAVLCRLQVRYWRNSVTLFEHALAVTKDNPVAHSNLGVALAEQGRVEEALGHFEQALRIEPDYPEAHNNLGLALWQKGKVQEAIRHFERVLQIRPDSAQAHSNLGVALSQEGKVQEAFGHFQQAVRINPDSAETQNNFGGALLQRGMVQEAIGHCERALWIAPDMAEAHYNLGIASERLGKVPEAIGHYEQALRIRPDYLGAQNDLARLLATLAPAEGGDPVRAVTLAQRACEITGNRVPAYLDTLAAAYAAVGRFNDAVATTEKAVELARAAGQPQVIKELERRLELYREGQVYRQPQTPVRSQSVNAAGPQNP
ncbi:MAG: tetratricopeptide repeat protein [Verrucomicrobiia bacterium]